MAMKDSSGRVEPACLPVIPLPIALYVSGELIFELYDGGQPCPPILDSLGKTKADCREGGREIVPGASGCVHRVTQGSYPIFSFQHLAARGERVDF